MAQRHRRSCPCRAVRSMCPRWWRRGRLNGVSEIDIISNDCKQRAENLNSDLHNTIHVELVSSVMNRPLPNAPDASITSKNSSRDSLELSVPLQRWRDS